MAVGSVLLQWVIPALSEVSEDFIADFVETDSNPTSFCQYAFKAPSAVLHPTQ